MKPTAFVVDTARGGVVAEDALADALEGRRIGGVGLEIPARLRLGPTRQAGPRAGSPGTGASWERGRPARMETGPAIRSGP